MQWTPHDPEAGVLINHAAIVPRDLERSLRFYTDGLGLEILVDVEVEGPFRRMFGSPEDEMHAIILGDPAKPDDGRLELVSYPGGAPDMAEGTGAFFLLSFMVDVAETVARLEELGLADQVQVEDRGGRLLGAVRDPDGILVELIEASLNGTASSAATT